MFGFVDDPRASLAAARAAGHIVALATIVSRSGGGPRPVGAQMVFSPDGPSGYLSGGCLEADVASHAAMVLSDGEPRRLTYGAGSPWLDIRLPCGGRIDVLVEAVPPADAAVAELLRRTDARLPAVLRSDGATRTCDDVPGGPEVYAKAFDPVARLIVLGADPTALAIASLAVQSGFETTLVRPHGPASPPPIAGVTYSRDDARVALARVGLDRYTAVAVATHDATVDHEALLTALPSPAWYVGVLGARRRLPDRLEALRKGGVTPADLARLRSPIGLDIGGESPWEVAIAVLAEIIESRRAMVSEGTADASSPSVVRAWARQAS
jgi:xanthine dehydrogenase accessory factor